MIKSNTSFSTKKSIRQTVLSSKCEKEQQVVEKMIRIYCSKKEKNQILCPECKALLAYAKARLSRCPVSESKSSCRQCAIHCYSPRMRERIQAVMRFSGPRMLLIYPVTAIRHLLKI